MQNYVYFATHIITQKIAHTYPETNHFYTLYYNLRSWFCTLNNFHTSTSFIKIHSYTPYFPVKISLGTSDSSDVFLEISKVQSMGRVSSRDQKYVDIYREKPMKVSVKVLVPVREHPKVKKKDEMNECPKQFYGELNRLWKHWT